MNALTALREAAKAAMFEASGVSDVMRAQCDPNETATAQQIKGRYAGLRLSERQKRMAVYARDMIRLMLEIGLEHFDTETIAEITGLDLPMTELARAAMLAEQQAIQAQYQRLVEMHAALVQGIKQGLMQGPPPPPPEPPTKVDIPETSWELVHAQLRDDFKRKITVSIETKSTVLVDEQEDKDSRIEFLAAFSTFIQQTQPLIATGAFDFKLVKELLLFGVRGFPKSRTLETLITSLPDEPEGKPPEDTQVQVAKIKAEVDKMLGEMDSAEKEKDRQHEMKMKGVDLIKDAAEMAGEAGQPPQPQTA